MSDLPDIDEANAELSRATARPEQNPVGGLPDIEELNAALSGDELPDIEEANAALAGDELPDIDEANAALRASRPKIGYNEMAGLSYEAATGADAPENGVLRNLVNVNSVGARGFAAGQMSAAQSLINGSERSDSATDSALSRMLYGTTLGTVASWFSTPDVLEDWDRHEGWRFLDAADRTKARNAYAAEIARQFIEDRVQTQTDAGTELQTREAKFGAQALGDLEQNLGYMVPFALGPLGIAAQFAASASGEAQELSNDQYALDEDGNLVMTAKGDSVGKAIAKGIGRASVATSVELVGGRLVGAGLKKAGGALAKYAVGKFPIISRTGGKIAATPVGKAVAKATTALNRLKGWTSRKLHLEGLGEEYIEEWLDPTLAETLGVERRGSEQSANPFARLWGAQKEFFTPENQGRLVTSLILLQGAGGFVAWAAQAPERRVKRIIDPFVVGRGLMTAEEAATATPEAKAESINEYVQRLDEREITGTLRKVATWAEKMGASLKAEAAKTEQGAPGTEQGAAAGDGAAAAEAAGTAAPRTPDEIALEEERAARAQKVHDLRGKESNPAEQVKEIEELGVTSWEQAEADGLTERDRYGRFVGGARRALNIAIHGTAKMKESVKAGRIGGEFAEELLSAAQCELGARPKAEQDALIDGILDRAQGDEALARRMLERLAEAEPVARAIGAEQGAELDAERGAALAGELDRIAAEVKAESIRERNPDLSEEDARAVASEIVETEDGRLVPLGETVRAEPTGADANGGRFAPKPQTAYEGAANAERLKGTKLHVMDNGLLGCTTFPNLRVQVSSEGVAVEGLTADDLAKPENAADAAAVIAQLDRIAQRNGIGIDFADETAKPIVAALAHEIKEQGLARAQAKLDTRAKLFGLLFKTTLGNGVTYDETSFRAALEKTPNGRPFVNSHGDIYGFVDGEGVLHFNPAAINFNTPIHEYGHLALEAIRGINPALWRRGMELVRNSEYFREIKGYSEVEGHEYAYLKGRDEGICDEALATMIGDRGARLVEDKGLAAELKAWLKEVWKAFRGAFGLADLTEEQIEKMTLGEFVDTVNAELLKGSEFGTRKRAPLSKTSTRKYDEDGGSGSNGLLRWKNDRGYLFALPVDLERTQPGGKVVLARAAGTGQGATAAEDAAYMDAVYRGDREAAEKMKRDAVARAMPNTKVVGADGKPMKVYHGSRTGANIKIFRTPSFFSDNRDVADMFKKEADFILRVNGEEVAIDDVTARQIADELTMGDYTPDEMANWGSFAESIRDIEDNGKGYGGRDVIADALSGVGIDTPLDEITEMSFMRVPDIYECYVNITNPLEIDFKGKTWGQEGTREMEAAVRNAARNGYDGVIVRNIREGGFLGELRNGEEPPLSTDYIPVSPNQIKVADAVTRDDAGRVIPLSRRFDKGETDVRFSVAREEDASWRTAVDDFVGGKLKPRSDATVLPRVPAVISRVLREKLGVDSDGRRIVVSSDCLKKAMQGKHRISAEQMKKLAVSLDAPLAVFQSKTRPKDTVTALVPIRDQDGGISSVVPLDYTARAMDGANALRITSVYGKLSAEAVQSWIDQGYLLYVDRKNISRSFPHRLQLPGRNKTANRFLDETDFSQEALGIVSNRGEERNGGGARFSIARLYTGSAADYERPSLHAVGTGEGATAAEDAAYMDAVKRGDMEAAKRLLKAAWVRSGYSADTSYRDAHAAPSAPVDAGDFKNAEALAEAREEGWDLNLWAIANGITGQPDDFFSKRGPRIYMYDDAAGREAQAAIASAIESIQGGNDKARIIVYRAVPKGVKFDGLQSGGQWVSPSRTYAENHGRSRFGVGKYRIVRQVVRAENLWWDGNDAREWGYDDGRQYVYRDAENGMKLATVTYDDAGNVIPLSQRFNAANPDIRMSVARVGRKDIALVTDIEGAAKISAKNPHSVEKYVLDHLEDNIEMLVGGTASITRESARHFAWSKVRLAEGRQLRQARARSATVIRDLISLFTADETTHQVKAGKKGTAWRCRLPIGVPKVERGRIVGGVVYDSDVILKDDGKGKFFYDISHLKKNEALTRQLNNQAEALVGAKNTAITQEGAGSASGASTAESIANRGEERNGGEAKFSVGRLYTGSAADYERPSLHAVGTGEGSQVYGWGLYASNVRGIAEKYANRAEKFFKNGKPINPTSDDDLKFDVEIRVAQTILSAGSVENAIKEVKDEIASIKRANNGRVGVLPPLMLQELIRHGTEYEVRNNHVYEQTWFTDRAPGDEGHLLNWYEMDNLKPGNSLHEQVKWIRRQAKSEGVKLPKDLGSYGGDVYETVANALGSPKAASEFLARAGIDGVKYPVDSYGGKAVKDGDAMGWNYVSFRDDNIRIDHKWRDGEAVFHVGRVNPKLREDVARLTNTDRTKGEIVRRNEIVEFSDTPDVLRLVGMPEARIVSRADILRKIKARHFLSDEAISELPDAYAAPAAVFRDGKNFVVLTDREAKTQAGVEKPVMVYLKESNDKGVDNFLASAYAREPSKEKVYSDLAKAENLLYFDKGKAARLNLEGETLSQLTPQGLSGLVKTPEDLSSLVSGDSIANSAERGNGGGAGAGLAPRAPDAGAGLAPRAQDDGARFAAERGANEPEIDLSRWRFGKKAEMLPGGVRVAADFGRGEQTPGALAMSRELSGQGRTPLSRLGKVHPMSLPTSELLRLLKDVTGKAVPASVAKKLPGGVAATHTASGKVAIFADVFGIVDRTDKAREKAQLKEHGFYRDEDPDWCATQTTAAIRAERDRSERQLAMQLDALGERRVRGEDPGGQSAARGVFAHEIAKVVMDMPRQESGVLGRVQKIGDGIRKEVARMAGPGGGAREESDLRGTAGAFLDWAHGGPLSDPQTGNPVGRGKALSLRDLTDEMFGSFLTMPQEMKARAPAWYGAILKTVAETPALAKAYRELSLRAVSGRAHKAVQEELHRNWSRETEARIAQLEKEVNEPISAGSKAADAKELTLVGFHDRMAPTVVRIDEKAKVYLFAKRETLRKMKERGATRSEIAAVESEIDRFTGNIAQRKNELELARTAYERGAANEGMVYFYRMLEVEDEATRAGLSEQNKLDYLYHRRVIETQGRAAARGGDVRQSQMILGDLARELGAERWAALELYGRKFHAVIGQEILNDPRVTRMLGKGYVDYLRTQVDYVTASRTYSVEEMDEIELAREAARQSGEGGGDDVVSEMFAHVGALGGGGMIGEDAWGKRLVGSHRDVKDVRGATWERHEKLMQVVRRNELVIATRDALLAAGVEGVRDLPRAERDFKDNRRYGHLNYIEDGEKRTLVVPRQIADGFARMPDSNRNVLLMINNFCRKLYIDYNPGYAPVDMIRNLGSIEKNMPGMHESATKSVLRAVAGPIAGVEQLVAQSILKRSKHLQRAANAVAAIPGFGNTPYQTMGDAHKVVSFLLDPNGFRDRLWDAKARGDAAAEAEAYRIVGLAREVLKSNMFVSFTSRTTGRATEGFANDVMNRHGLYTLAQEIEREGKKRSLLRRAVESKWNAFARNKRIIEYNDMFAKTVAYLHDRQAFGAVRTAQESGVVVKRNVGLGEVERCGTATKPIQLIINQFFNAIEKGLVQHGRAIRERPVPTLTKDFVALTGLCIGSMAAKGVYTAAMRALFGDDEDKIRASAVGGVYDYLLAYERAYSNCSNYIRENYYILPLANLGPNGYTSVVLTLPLDDQDRMFSWIADQVSGRIAEKCGRPDMRPRQGVFESAMNATIRAVTPDLAFATPVFDMLKIVFSLASGNAPTDSFRGTPLYDKDVWDLRGESLQDMGDFLLATGKVLSNDLGGRMIYKFDYNGVDNGDGDAPKWLGLTLKRIPVLSPMLNRFVRIQVGSPDRDLARLKDDIRRVENIVRRSAMRLMVESAARGGALNEVEPKRYAERLEGWQKTYGLSDAAMQKIETDFLNGWNDHLNEDDVKRKKAERIMKRADKLGIEKAEEYIYRGQL